MSVMGCVCIKESWGRFAVPRHPLHFYSAVYTGILTACKETHDDVIRFAPPLVITRDEVDWAIDRIQRVFQQLD